MVQKSQTITVWMYKIKNVISTTNLSTGFLAGFLVAINSIPGKKHDRALPNSPKHSRNFEESRCSSMRKRRHFLLEKLWGTCCCNLQEKHILTIDEIYMYINIYIYMYVFNIYILLLLHGYLYKISTLIVFPRLKWIRCFHFPCYSLHCVRFMCSSHWLHHFHRPPPLGKSSSLRCNALDFHNPMASWR